MSQEKVDKYKKEKAKRKKAAKKARTKEYLSIVVAAAIGVAIVGYIGYSAYDSLSGAANKQAETSSVTTQVDTDAISEYMTNLYAES